MIGFLKRPVVGEAETLQAARRLADTLAPFSPTKVLYIASGGEALGRAIAAQLLVPVDALDICYPASRVTAKPVRRAIFPFKELLYRFTRPVVNLKIKLHAASNERVVLVDDSAATGRTLRVALSTLKAAGIPRERVRTAVYRKGSGVAELVDCYETTSRVRFVHRPHRK